MSLRDALLSAGLKPRDIRKAVKQARQTAQYAVMGARVVEGAMVAVVKKLEAKNPRAQKVAVLAGKAARIVREVAEETLRKR